MDNFDKVLKPLDWFAEIAGKGKITCTEYNVQLALGLSLVGYGIWDMIIAK